ncbi:hypothetical protein OROGR_016184 [Orobanche gracilis]
MGAADGTGSYKRANLKCLSANSGVRKEVDISENQFGFMPGRSSTEAIHLVRRLMEKFRERRRDLHMVFIDLEKTYDSISRDVIWRSVEEKRVSLQYVRVIQDMYSQVKTCVRTPVGDTQFFPVEIGLHQGSALTPCSRVSLNGGRERKSGVDFLP